MVGIGGGGIERNLAVQSILERPNSLRERPETPQLCHEAFPKNRSGGVPIGNMITNGGRRERVVLVCQNRHGHIVVRV